MKNEWRMKNTGRGQNSIRAKSQKAQNHVRNSGIARPKVKQLVRVFTKQHQYLTKSAESINTKSVICRDAKQLCAFSYAPTRVRSASLDLKSCHWGAHKLFSCFVHGGKARYGWNHAALGSREEYVTEPNSKGAKQGITLADLNSWSWAWCWKHPLWDLAWV